jgi:hypothetical protein
VSTSDTSARNINANAMRRVLVPYCTIGTAIALLLPESLATHLSWLMAVTHGAGQFIPGIARWASLSPFPEVTRLYMTTMWAGLPLVAALLTVRWQLPQALLKSDVATKIGGVFVLVIVIGLSTFLVALPPSDLLGSDARGALLQRSIARTGIGLALFGCIIFSTFAVSIAIALNVAKAFTRRN